MGNLGGEERALAFHLVTEIPDSCVETRAIGGVFFRCAGMPGTERNVEGRFLQRAHTWPEFRVDPQLRVVANPVRIHELLLSDLEVALQPLEFDVNAGLL